jgi:hypothetical protein
MKIFLMVRKCNCLFFLKNKLRQSVVNYPTNGWAKSKKKNTVGCFYDLKFTDFNFRLK